jgi:hypothetical protein
MGVRDATDGGSPRRTGRTGRTRLGVTLALLVSPLVSIAIGAAPGGAAPTWVPSAAPTAGLDPPAQPGMYLFGMSCLSATSCVAVGDYPVSGSETAGDAVIEVGSMVKGSWKWKASTAPTSGLTPPADPSDSFFLGGVSCPSTTSCIAAGFYNEPTDEGVGGVGLIEVGTRAGKTWTWVPSNVPTSGLSPAADPSELVGLYGVSCGSATSCVAAGVYNSDETGTVGDGLLEVGTLAAGTWTWAAGTAPLTHLNPAADTRSPNVFLNGVSCSSHSQCVAAGSYLDTKSNEDGLLEVGTLAGGTWTWTPSTAPTSGVAPASDGDVVLGGVSCPSATSCVAGGSYSFTTNGERDGLFEVGTRASGIWTWTPSTAPATGLSPAAKSGDDVEIDAVACPTPSLCIAVGGYNSFGGADGLGLIEEGTLSDGTWSWASSTAPIAGLPGSPPTMWNLFGVSCWSGAACVAAGYEAKASGDQYGLFEAGTLAS